MRRFFSDLYKKHKQFQAQSDEVADHLLAVNFERLSFIGYVAIPVHLLHILLFWNFSGTRNEILWRNGIILSHSVLLIYMVGLIGVTRYFAGGRRTRKAMMLTLWATLTVMLLAGVAIVTIDQLVTTNITPFLVVCTITSMLFLLRPAQAILVYVMGYCFYFWSLGLTQMNQAVLLSNRVNGITAVGIAVALSVILWRSAVVAELQERKLKLSERELREKNAKLKEYAFFDGLTGLYNRRTAYELIVKEQEQMRRSGSSAIVLLLDIDFFKRINDQYGHLVGDKVLQEVGKVLATRFRKEDITARWGGEEFLCCLFNVKPSDIHVIAEDLRKAVAAIKVEGVNVTVTASIGVAVLDPKGGTDFEKAYHNADEALYFAKEAGRNRVEIYPSVNDSVLSLSIESKEPRQERLRLVSGFFQ